MPVYHKCGLTGCAKSYNRSSRLISHLIKNSECALNIDNIQYLINHKHTDTLLNIHSRYYPLTSQRYDCNAYRETRKILKDTYITEQTRQRKAAEDAYRDLSNRYAIAKTLIETEATKVTELTTANERLIAENDSLKAENERLLEKMAARKGKLIACRDENAEQLTYENQISDLMSRLYNSMPVKYTFRMSSADLYPFIMPSGDVISDLEFDTLHNNPASTPLDVISDFAYRLFSNASEGQLVYVHNIRERILYMLPSALSTVPIAMSAPFLSNIVAHILRELRNHIIKMQERVARKWDPVVSPEHLGLLRPTGMSNQDQERLDTDRVSVWKGTSLYSYCNLDFIREHKSKYTKAEVSETKKVCKTTEMITGHIVRAFSNLNRDYAIKRNASDSVLIKRFT